jgi:hypothetical protein
MLDGFFNIRKTQTPIYALCVCACRFSLKREKREKRENLYSILVFRVEHMVDE